MLYRFFFLSLNDKYLPSEEYGTNLKDQFGAFVQNKVTNSFLCAIFSFTESSGLPINESKEKMKQGKPSKADHHLPVNTAGRPSAPLITGC